jgi:hypothetical protein
MADDVALRFTGFAREVAGVMEECYRQCWSLQKKWAAESAGSHVPNDSTPMDDGVTGQPVTGADVTNIITRAAEITAWGDGSGGAVIGTVLKVSNMGIGE